MEKTLEELNPTGRFSDRVDNYAKYRPSYPTEAITYISKITKLPTGGTVADIGSGTGIFSALLLQKDYRVFCVEPNEAMRTVAEKNLSIYPNFSSIDGTAECTTLNPHSVDIVTVAQAFHWVDISAKEEFSRILKPAGLIVLLWNIRLRTTPFLEAFEDLKVEFGTDYKAVNMLKEQDIRAFFYPKPVTTKEFFHAQNLDYEGLRGQLLSSSYVPIDGEKSEQMIAKLKGLFDEHQIAGQVTIEYATKVYINK